MAVSGKSIINVPGSSLSRLILVFNYVFVGEKEGNKKACMMILSKVVDDPQSGTCLNVSYADVSGPVANYNPTGSPFAQQNAGSAFSTSTASLNTGLGSMSQSIMLNGGLNLSLNLNATGQNMGSLTTQIVENIKVNLKVSQSKFTEDFFLFIDSFKDVRVFGTAAGGNLCGAVGASQIRCTSDGSGSRWSARRGNPRFELFRFRGPSRGGQHEYWSVRGHRSSGPRRMFG